MALWQAFAAVLMALLTWLLCNAYEAVSAALGGLTASLATLFMALKARAQTSLTLHDNDEQIAVGLLQQFYRSEVSKIVLTLAMFVICIIVIKVSVAAYVIAYLVAALVVNWLTLLILHRAPS